MSAWAPVAGVSTIGGCNRYLKGGKGDAEGRVVYAERQGLPNIRGVHDHLLPSPPPPASRVTSGLRKASRAASADKDAASARFPLWSRICTSTLKDHTCCMNLLLSALP